MLALFCFHFYVSKCLARKKYTSILYTIAQIIAKNIAPTRHASSLPRLAEPIRVKLRSRKSPARELQSHFCGIDILLGNLKKVEVGYKLLYYVLRASHNIETVCKKSDFCFQLGGKAEFMINK